MPRKTMTEQIALRVSNQLSALSWHTPSHVYNPLEYAWSGHREYLTRYGSKRGRVLLVGMNPGPWGMAQTGVPFGNISSVRYWFDIHTTLSQNLPAQHPKYPILGMDCHRDEGSGQRLWNWARERFGTPERFFDQFFIWNYCPLLFLAENRNLIPEKLSADESRELTRVCDEALKQIIDKLRPVATVGIGRYAEKKLFKLAGNRVPVRYLLHPSPANPTANRCWTERADETLGPWLP